MVSIKARFDGKALIPSNPVDLPQDREITIHIEADIPDARPGASHNGTIWEKLLSMAGTAEHLPEDASENHDHYLYGTPKR